MKRSIFTEELIIGIWLCFALGVAQCFCTPALPPPPAKS